MGRKWYLVILKLFFITNESECFLVLPLLQIRGSFPYIFRNLGVLMNSLHNKSNISLPLVFASTSNQLLVKNK